MLTDKSVRDLIAAFASSDPTPGGGSAAALASAVGAALLTMVASLPKTRSGSEEDRAALAAAAGALMAIRQQLVDAVDADTAAYDGVVAAFKLPKGTPAEQESRKGAIQRAMRKATDVPLGVMRLSRDALRHATAVAAHGHRGAASDVGVAVALLDAGAKGARLNVDINLGSVGDQAYVAAARAETDRLAADAAAAAADAQAPLTAA